MAVPVFDSAGAGDGNTGVSLAPPYPATVAAGDLLILHVGIRMTIDTETVSTPGGWDLVTGPFTREFESRGYVFGKLAAGTETGTQSLSFDTGSNVKAARIYRFTGNSTTAGAYVEDADGTGDTGTSITMNAVTCSGTDRLAVSFLTLGGNTTAGSSTGETGGDWVEALAEFGTAAGAGMALQLQTASMASGGTITGGLTAVGASITAVVQAMAIKPFAGSGSVSDEAALRTAHTPVTWRT